MKFTSTHLTLRSSLVFAILCFGIAFAQPQPSDPSFEWQERGRSLYATHCSSCHAQDGSGMPGVFPPLAGHVSDILSPAGGRDYLMNVLLYGVVGPIEANGQPYNGAMPMWNLLSDDDVAAILNHIATSWGNQDALRDDLVLYAPSDVAQARDRGLTAADVHALRAEALQVAAITSSGPEVVLNDEVGYYTEEQARIGQGLYEQHCSGCHGATLRGGPHEPPLTQLGFFRSWGDQTFDSLFAYYSANMPFGSSTRLPASQYVAIGAYWLQFHEYPSGDRELTADPETLRQIIIERR